MALENSVNLQNNIAPRVDEVPEQESLETIIQKEVQESFLLRPEVKDEILEKLQTGTLSENQKKDLQEALSDNEKKEDKLLGAAFENNPNLNTQIQNAVSDELFGVKKEVSKEKLANLKEEEAQQEASQAQAAEASLAEAFGEKPDIDLAENQVIEKEEPENENQDMPETKVPETLSQSESLVSENTEKTQPPETNISPEKQNTTNEVATVSPENTSAAETVTDDNPPQPAPEIKHETVSPELLAAEKADEEENSKAAEALLEDDSLWA